VCPKCRSDLEEEKQALICSNSACQSIYPIEDGIALLLPDYNEEQVHYQKNYEAMAKKFLETNKYKDDNVAYRHGELLRFIGRGKKGRVLDIGSSHGLYLNKIDAEFRVAVDISLSYLRLLSKSTDIVPIQADAEYLPFKPHFFDVIITADLLEHLLKPENMVSTLARICDRSTRVYVHVPWEEDLEPYVNSEWEFSHLRSFNAYKFGSLWASFYIKRCKGTYPNLTIPFIFTLDGKVPRLIYNKLVERYFFKTNVSKADLDWRMKKLKELRKREWWLLWFYKPVFKMFEMRLR
jgi:SAM-dependent methyltransferase